MFKYIVFEGIDGTGKSTLAREVANLLNYRFVCEPSMHSEITKTLRKFALDSKNQSAIPPIAREYLMLANRAILAENIKRNDCFFKGTVSDRSLVSGMTYAKVCSGISNDEWWTIGKHAFQKLPDIIINLMVEKQNIKGKPGDIYDFKEQDFFNELLLEFPNSFKFFKRECNIPTINFLYSFDKPASAQAFDIIKYLKGLD